MSDPLACPYCGFPARKFEKNTEGGTTWKMLACSSNEDCPAIISGYDWDELISKWNRRTPPPATAEFLAWAKEYGPENCEPWQDRDWMERFIAEWA